MTSYLVHLSDPHFGTEDPGIARALLGELRDLAPAAITVSGDLTQRARRHQFRAARAWLDALPAPVVVVPGNHDIPLYDVLRRFLAPRDRFWRYITSDPFPCVADETVAVVGVDTTKSLTTKHGQITRVQAAHVAGILASYTNHWRVLVAHHPFVVPPDSAEPTVDGGDAALPLLEQAGLDLILTGHLHIPHSAGSSGRNVRHTIVSVHAGTCMSSRLRGEPNGYNVLAFDGDEVTIVHREWRGGRFVDGDQKCYRRGRRERLEKIAEVPPLPITPPELVH